MAQILLRHYVIAIIVFSMFITGIAGIFTQIRSIDPDYGESTEITQFSATFDKLNDVNDSVTAMKDSITGNELTDTDVGTFGVLNALIGGAWQSLRTIFSSFAFMETAIGGLYSYFGVPSWVGNGILLIITTIIIFTIWGAIFQREL